ASSSKPLDPGPRSPQGALRSCSLHCSRGLCSAVRPDKPHNTNPKLRNAFAKDSLQHLSRIVLRQFIQEHIRFRPLEARDILQTEPVELALESRRVGVPRDHARHDLLAPVRMATAD